MRIKVFKAPTMKEAMANVKAELGEDAVILHTKRYRKSGLMGFRSKEIIEIIAAVEDQPVNERINIATAGRDGRLDISSPAGGIEDYEAEEYVRPSAVIPEQSVRMQQPVQPEIQQSEPVPMAVRPPRGVVNQYKTTGTAQQQEEIPVHRKTMSDVVEDIRKKKERPYDARTIAEEEYPLPQDEDYPYPDDDYPIPAIPESSMESASSEPAITEPVSKPEIIIPQMPAINEAPVIERLEPVPPVPPVMPVVSEQPVTPIEVPVPEVSVPETDSDSADEEEVVEPVKPKKAPSTKKAGRKKKEAEPVEETVEDTADSDKDEEIIRLQEELEKMKAMLSQAVSEDNKEEKVINLQTVLAMNDVNEKVIQDMVKRLNGSEIVAPKDSAKARNAFEKYLGKTVRTATGITLLSGRPKIVALIGATGVGKTTTLAKIAAKFVLEQGVSAAMITADTYRISAVEQLKTYSDIIGLPLEIVYSPDALKKAIDKHKNKQLILIDTAGRSQYNKYQMQELSDLLAVDKSIEKHLVMSATTKNRDAEEILLHFAPCNPDRVIFTKTDETSSAGVILNLLHKKKIALSYMTNGQSVPDDIYPASVEKLADLLLR